MDSLTLTADSGQSYSVPSDAVVVFLDETGHEHFADPHYPIFGLGGCLVRVGDYRKQLFHPWRGLKRKHLGTTERPLHAADLGDLRPSIAPDVGEFFHRALFGRVAVLTTAKSAVPQHAPGPWLLAGLVMKRVGRVVSALGIRPSEVWVLAEDSERLGHQLAGHLDGYRLQADEGEYSVKPRVRLMGKSSNEPGLEVADFIMHAAGGTARGWVNLGGDPERADFQAVFQPSSVPEHMVEYQEVLDVQVQ